MRRIASVVCLALALAACDGDGRPDVSPSVAASPSASPSVAPSSSSVSPSVSPSVPPSASSTPEPHLQLPADAPTELADPADLTAIAAGDLTPLVPPDATVTHSAVLATPTDLLDRIALTWRRGDDPFASEQGFIAWVRVAGVPPWRAVYAFTDRPREGVLGIDFETDDLTGDGLVDALTLEQQGGSGACGTWRVVVSTADAATEVFRRSACDTEIRISGGALALREAVYEPDDPHCCPSAFRYATLEWDGEAFVETSSEVVANPS